jgi:hypothetical protein
MAAMSRHIGEIHGDERPERDHVIIRRSQFDGAGVDAHGLQ